MRPQTSIPAVTLSLILAAGLSSSAFAQSAPAPDYGGSLLQMLFGLFLVLGLMVAALWLLKRISTPQSSSNGRLLKIIAGIGVGTRERVVIIEAGDKWLVLGVAPGRVSSLAELPRQVVPAEAVPTTQKDFSHWLKQIMESRRAP